MSTRDGALRLKQSMQDMISKFQATTAVGKFNESRRALSHSELKEELNPIIESVVQNPSSIYCSRYFSR